MLCTLYAASKLRLLKSLFPQVLALCLIIGVWLPGSYTAANLLASKVILNDYLVEGKDLTIKYSIYNVGTRYRLHIACAWHWLVILVWSLNVDYLLSIWGHVLVYGTHCIWCVHSAAVNVVLEDASFPEEHFSIEQGLLMTTWDKIQSYLTYLRSRVCVCVCVHVHVCVSGP